MAEVKEGPTTYLNTTDSRSIRVTHSTALLKAAVEGPALCTHSPRSMDPMKLDTELKRTTREYISFASINLIQKWSTLGS